MKKIMVILSLVCFLFLNNSVCAGNVDVITDENNLLSSNTSEIITIANEIKVKFDVSIHLYIYDDKAYSNLSDSYVQSVAETKANKFMEDNYGSYDNDVIVIILGYDSTSSYNAVNYNKWLEINCYGDTDRYISNTKAQSLFNKFADEFSLTKNYNSSLEYLFQKIESTMVFSLYIPHIIISCISLGLAIFVAVSLVFSRGAKKEVNYNTYSNNSSQVLGRYDRYVRTTVTRTPRSSSSSGGGGGGGRSSGGGGRF